VNGFHSPKEQKNAPNFFYIALLLVLLTTIPVVTQQTMHAAPGSMSSMTSAQSPFRSGDDGRNDKIESVHEQRANGR
jgi:hypothetical protein